MEFGIPLFALGCFLVLNLYVSFRASRGIKTFRDYALANRHLGGGLLIMTLFATLLSSDNIGLRFAYGRGLISLLYPLSFALMAMLLGWFVFPKLVAFEGCYGVTDVMRKLYGPFGAYGMLGASTFFSLLVIVAQLRTLGELGSFFGFAKWEVAVGQWCFTVTPDAQIICLVGGLVMVYTCLGGVRSVVATDVLQFVLILAGFLLLTSVVLISFGGVTSILKLEKVPNREDMLIFGHHPYFRFRLLGALFWAIWPTSLISPPVIQRVLMTKKKEAVRHMFLSFSLLYPLLRVVMVLVAFGLLIKAPDLALRQFSLGEAVEKVSSNPLVSILFCLAVVAIIMSTIDSFLNALAILWVREVSHLQKQRPVAFRGNVQQIRLFALFFGFIALLPAIFSDMSLFELSGYAIVGMAPLALPFLMGICGLKGSPKALKASVATFFGTLLLLVVTLSLFFKEFFEEISIIKLLGFEEDFTEGFLPKIETLFSIPLLISILVFFAVHYVSNGHRFIWVTREKNKWLQRERSYRLHLGWEWLKAPATWARKKVKEYGREPYLFGLFTFFLFLLPPVGGEGSEEQIYFIVLLRIAGLLFSGILLAESIWPKRLRKYFSLFYLLTVFYCVPLVHLLSFYNDPKGPLVFVSMIIAIVWLALLVDWRTFLLFEIFALLCATLVNKWREGVFFPTWLGDNPSYLLNIGYAFLVCLLFLRKSQLKAFRERKKLESEKAFERHILKEMFDVQRQVASSLHPKSSMMRLLREKTASLSSKGNAEAIKPIEDALLHLEEMGKRSEEHLRITPQKMEIATWLAKSYQLLVDYGEQPADSVDLHNHLRVTHIEGDPFYLELLVLNAVRYIKKNSSQEVKVKFLLSPTTIDYGLGIKQRALRLTFSAEEAENEDEDAQGVKGIKKLDDLLLIKNERIVRAHYGFFFLHAKEGIKQEYTLPVNLGVVRPKIGNFADENLEAEKSVPLRGSEVNAFIEKIEEIGFSKEEIARITKALQVATYYHRHQLRKSGEAYFLHPLGVAEILLPYSKDADLFIAALLHDVVEDTSYTMWQLAATFGDRVAGIVDAVTHLYNSQGRKVRLQKRDSLMNLLQEADPDPLLIKLADRLHNMRTINGHPAVLRRKEIAEETMEFFVPVAERLQCPKIKEELVKLCRAVLG